MSGQPEQGPGPNEAPPRGRPAVEGGGSVAQEAPTGRCPTDRRRRDPHPDQGDPGGRQTQPERPQQVWATPGNA